MLAPVAEFARLNLDLSVGTVLKQCAQFFKDEHGFYGPVQRNLPTFPFLNSNPLV